MPGRFWIVGIMNRYNTINKYRYRNNNVFQITMLHSIFVLQLSKTELIMFFGDLNARVGNAPISKQKN